MQIQDDENLKLDEKTKALLKKGEKERLKRYFDEAWRFKTPRYIGFILAFFFIWEGTQDFFVSRLEWGSAGETIGGLLTVLILFLISKYTVDTID